jgi:mycothiol synthase
VIELRPPGADELPAVLGVLEAREETDGLDPSILREFIREQWHAARWPTSKDAVVADHDGVLAGFAAALRFGGHVCVHPGLEGRGVGSALLRWLLERERTLGRTWHRQRTAQGNTRAAVLLTAAGYRQARINWQMVHDLRGLPVVLPPPGITLHPLDPEHDAAALHAADTAAFAENADYEPETLEEFRAEHLRVHHFDREASVIARAGAEIAGYAMCEQLPGGVGYIDLLAVVPGHRRRGLGRLLLLHALGSFARTGRRDGRLEVASDNPPAMRLYEQAGMRARAGAAIWERPVGRPQCEMR